MRRRLLPLGLAALLFNPVFAQYPDAPPARVPAPAVAPTAPLTLDAALRYAFAANPTLAAAAREVDALEAAIVQARARRNPEISAFVEDTRRATRTTTVQIDQPIELGGKRGARIDAAEQGRDAAAAGHDAARAELRAAVTAAFHELLAAQENLRLAQASVDLAQRAADVAARRVAAGKVSPVEETRARVAAAAARSEHAQAAGALATARQRLGANWGELSPRFRHAEGDLQALPALPAPADLERRLAASPAMRQARLEVGRRQALAAIERRRSTPDLTVSLGAQRNEELGLDQAILGVSMPIPVFDRNRGNLLEAQHRIGQARDALAARHTRLTSELMAARERLGVARTQTETMRRDILPGAQSALDAAIRGFEFGKFSFLDVLDAQRTLVDARAQSLRALLEAHRAAAEIERILGDAPAVANQP